LEHAYSLGTEAFSGGTGFRACRLQRTIAEHTARLFIEVVLVPLETVALKMICYEK
jgi:hypothetical protein|tara:strand:- start:598 stop:765 length:168 start_codon:yes stop_codon:yes gene_type:complete